MKKEKTNMFGGNSAKDVLCVLLKNDKKGRPCEIEREENQKKGYFMDYYSLAYNRGGRTRGSDALRRTTEYKDLQEFNEDPFGLRQRILILTILPWSAATVEVLKKAGNVRKCLLVNILLFYMIMFLLLFLFIQKRI